MPQFLHDADDDHDNDDYNDDAMAIAIPRVFSLNSRADKSKSEKRPDRKKQTLEVP